jgi:hypothetical protein
LPASPAWSQEACQDWIDRVGGIANGGKIGGALKPLVKKFGWIPVRKAWKQFLSQQNTKAIQPHWFAERYGEWAQAVSFQERAALIEARRRELPDERAAREAREEAEQKAKAVAQ